jgi:hypothetical protein
VRQIRIIIGTGAATALLSLGDEERTTVVRLACIVAIKLRRR